MRFVLAVLLTLICISANGQKYHKCTIYSYYGDDSLHHHLCSFQVFNDHQKIVAEDSYKASGDDDPIKYKDTCTSKTCYFYKDDTLLEKDVHYTIAYPDTTITYYKYDDKKLLVTRNEWVRNHMQWNRDDTQAYFIKKESYRYNVMGDKIESRDSILKGGKYELSFTSHWAYDKKSRLIYEDNYENGQNDINDMRRTYWKRYEYTKDGMKETEQIEIPFKTKMETLYRYNYAEGVVLSEQRSRSCTRYPFGPLVQDIIHTIYYSYFPEKRVIKEICDMTGFPTETKIYVYE